MRHSVGMALVLVVAVAQASPAFAEEDQQDQDDVDTPAPQRSERIPKDDPNWKERQEQRSRADSGVRNAKWRALRDEGLDEPVLGYADFALYQGKTADFLKETVPSKWNCAGTIFGEVSTPTPEKSHKRTKPSRDSGVAKCRSQPKNFDEFRADAEKAVEENSQQPPSKMQEPVKVVTALANTPKYRGKLCPNGKIEIHYRTLYGPIGGSHSLTCYEERHNTALCGKGWTPEVSRSTDTASGERTEVVVCSRVTTSCPAGFSPLPASMGKQCYKCPAGTKLDQTETAAFNAKLANTTSRVGTYFYRTGEKLLCRGAPPLPKGAIEWSGFGGVRTHKNRNRGRGCYVYEGEESVGDTWNYFHPTAGQHHYRVECEGRDPVEVDVTVVAGKTLEVKNPQEWPD